MPRSSREPRHLGDEARHEIIDDMGMLWQTLGMPRAEGRIVGCLMLSNAPSMSSAELMEELGSSPAGISTATRRLVDVGFIKRVTQTGQRGHFFKVEDDVWGAFLAGERAYLDKRAAFAESVLEKLGTGDEGPRRRVTNMRDYMAWLSTYHRKMLDDYEKFKQEREANG
ncbi:GbsR/MarR family transcriptional regulator [Amycolatopsis jejuensis]|uniref:GbsR/MarR family transcriptional regulator n=1 Tax=Amycolatopsis jejuensis TaxID=330084 RepID=UPI00068D3ED8|nr:MarR family transcriptional regulator [Amycolatopsis jejuensis]